MRRATPWVPDPVLIGDYVIQPVIVTWGEESRVEIPSPVLRVRDLTEEEEAEAMEAYIRIGDAPVTGASIPGIGSLSGRFSEREVIQLQVAVKFGQ